VIDDADEDAVRKFAKRCSINYPVAMATDEMRFQFGSVPTLSTPFIIDAQGWVVQKHRPLKSLSGLGWSLWPPIPCLIFALSHQQSKANAGSVFPRHWERDIDSVQFGFCPRLSKYFPE
jgi:hypothetical protein